MDFDKLQKAYIRIIEDDSGEVSDISIRVMFDERSKNRMKLNGKLSLEHITVILFNADICNRLLDEYYDEIRLYPSGDERVFITPVSLALNILKSYNREEYEKIKPYYYPEHSKLIMEHHINGHQSCINNIERLKSAL